MGFSWGNWFRNIWVRHHSRPVRRKERHRMIQLEDRTLLAAFVVNSTLDTVDVTPGDGIAVDANGNTTLRAAVMEANALAGDDTITLGAGLYQFTLGGAGGTNQGDLDLTSNSRVTIQGAGLGQTTIDGAGSPRSLRPKLGGQIPTARQVRR